MKERIDNFMKVVREKYNKDNEHRWIALYNRLSDAIPKEHKDDLVMQWETYMMELKLELWDQDFMEMVINGGRQEELSVAESGASNILNKRFMNNGIPPPPQPAAEHARQMKEYAERLQARGLLNK